MTKKLYSEKIKHFAFQKVTVCPYMIKRRNNKVAINTLRQLLYTDTLMRGRIFKDINTSQTFFRTKILTDNSNKIVEMLFVLQLYHFPGKVVKTEFFIF